jgi:glucokinase
MAYFIGIDLGGTKIAAALLDLPTGQVSAQTVVSTQAHEGPDAVLKRIGQTVRQVCQKAGLTLAEVGGVGLGMPATFDASARLVQIIPNLPGEWYNKPAVDILEADLGRPVYLINDARAFTLAEATLGAGKGAHTVVGVTLGTGIGGGIAIGGQLHLGLQGAAGEFGHHSIDMDGLPDGTGNPGGWEGLASGPSIAAMGMKAVTQGITTQIGPLVDFDLNKITPEVILRAAQAGDEVAQAILDRAGFYLGTGLANIITILAPNRVVIGGGVAHLGDWILKPIRATLQQRVHTVPLDQVGLVYAALGGEAGVIGAALWASQSHHQ